MRNTLHFRLAVAYMAISCLVILIFTTPLAAQKATLVPDRVSCRGCSIKLIKVSELGNEYGDPGAQGGALVLARDSRGYIYGVYNGAPAEIVVHDRNGAVIRKLGRKGGGPGEFQNISEILVSTGDTLHVLDRISRRRTVISPKWQVVDHARLPGSAMSALMLADGSVVINSNILTPESAGYPLHLISDSHTFVRSFGADTAAFRPDLSHLLSRHLSPSSGTNFWAGHYNEYRLDLWDPSGQRLATVTRQPDWFKPWYRSVPPSPTSPPQPYMAGLQQNERGQLIVITRVPKSDWKKGLEPGRENSYRIVDPEYVFGSVIEVLDPQSGRLLVSQRFTEALGGFIDENHIVSYSADREGYRYITVWRVQVVQS